MSTKRNVVFRIPGFSRQINRRALLTATIAVLLLIISICLFTAFDTNPLSLKEVINGLIGGGDDPLAQLTVRRFRLPRILTGILIGLALGLSGAIFQSISRNGLVSPDIIGVNSGAAVVAVFMITTGTSLRLLPLWAFIGAFATSIIVYIAAMQRRHLAPYRLILVGIAVNAMLASLLTFLILRSATDLNSFASAQRWLLGNVAPATWANVRTLAVILTVMIIPLIVLSRHLEPIQLGDSAARGLGVKLQLSRLSLVAIGSLLAATAVAFAGPIGFVAFAAPHIARRLVAGNDLGALLCAGLIGALMVSSGDYIARRLIEPSELPVGAVTTILCCPYFLLLLYRANRQGSAL